MPVTQLSFVVESSFGSKWNFSAKMSTYRQAHTRIMFRCWILHLPLCLLWQPHYPIRVLALSFIGLSLFHFSCEERARLLQQLRGLLLSALFADCRWHELSADAWFYPGIAWPLHVSQWMNHEVDKRAKNFYHPIPNTHGLLPTQWIVNSCTSDRQ